MNQKHLLVIKSLPGSSFTLLITTEKNVFCLYLIHFQRDQSVFQLISLIFQ